MERLRRIAAYGVCRRDDGQVLLAWWPRGGVWTLPGGGVRHGEDPRRAVVRAVAGETGLAVEPGGVLAVETLMTVDGPAVVHVDAVVFALAGRGGQPRPEAGRARWCTPGELADLPLDAFARPLLGLPALPRPAPEYPAEPAHVAEARLRAGDRGQRFSAYALATDPAGRALLTRNAPGYPHAGSWHLPGGGTDFGERAEAAVLRELVEETDQVGRVTGLLEVRHQHTPRALGPEGRPLDWHVVRVLYRVAVDRPTAALVRDASGSTAEARWFARREVADLRLTPAAEAGLAWW